MEKIFIYLDDIRIPKESSWVIVRNYQEFVDKVNMIGLNSIDTISLDHDLGPQATTHFLNYTVKTDEFNYKLIAEKTGLDCAKFLVEKAMNENVPIEDFPKVVVHSANPIGSGNIMGYVNNFFYRHNHPQTCVRVKIDHTIDREIVKKIQDEML